jgi:hypothetical protein
MGHDFEMWPMANFEEVPMVFLLGIRHNLEMWTMTNFKEGSMAFPFKLGTTLKCG